ncbi:hypothetical protein [Nocardia sp. NPDC058497]|uniref:hypothetical protein n=1 Tax=Nocardia sp. NPDC058497 TaxID=3346529 RepID=UPI00364F8DF3
MLNPARWIRRRRRQTLGSYTLTVSRTSIGGKPFLTINGGDSLGVVTQVIDPGTEPDAIRLAVTGFVYDKLPRIVTDVEAAWQRS